VNSLPGRWFHVLVGVFLLAVLWAASTPGWDLAIMLIAGTGLALLGFMWLLRVGFHLKPLKWQMLLAPAMALGSLVLVALDAPLSARWALSKSAFERAIRNGTPYRDDQWIGLYHVVRLSGMGERSLLFETSGGFTQHQGFAYLPDGPEGAPSDPSLERPTFTHLGGDWYVWSARW
jgi:hypothetical protein